MNYATHLFTGVKSMIRGTNSDCDPTTHSVVYALEVECAVAAAALSHAKDEYDRIVDALPQPAQWVLHNRLDMLGKAVLGICDDMVSVHARAVRECDTRRTAPASVEVIAAAHDLREELQARIRDMSQALAVPRRAYTS